MEIDDALLDVLSSTSQLDRHLIKVQEHMERFDDACDAKRICEEGIPVTAIANIRSELENVSYIFEWLQSILILCKL